MFIINLAINLIFALGVMSVGFWLLSIVRRSRLSGRKSGLAKWGIWKIFGVKEEMHTAPDSVPMTRDEYYENKGHDMREENARKIALAQAANSALRTSEVNPSVAESAKAIKGVFDGEAKS